MNRKADYEWLQNVAKAEASGTFDERRLSLIEGFFYPQTKHAKHEMVGNDIKDQDINTSTLDCRLE